MCHSGMLVLQDINPIPLLSLNNKGKELLSALCTIFFPPLTVQGEG